MEYKHGGDIYTNEGMLDFSVNVNPFGASDSVKAAAKEAVEFISNYPDSRCRKLRGILADKLYAETSLAEETGQGREGRRAEETGRDSVFCRNEKANRMEDMLVFGNGAADLIFALVLAEKPQKAVLTAPSFLEYEQALRTVDCQIKYHKLRAEQQFRLQEDYLDELTPDIDLIFLCSPDNPSGQIIERELLERILKKCEQNHIRMVLDECFYDFLDEPQKATFLSAVSKRPQLFLLRAFTKMYAMPGLRLGYGICSDRNLTERMESVRQPWSVSVVAQAAGVAALKEEGRMREIREKLAVERSFLENGLCAAGIEYIPSQANYILLKSTVDLYAELKKYHILIRDCSNYRGLEKGYYRIAVRRREENEYFLRTVQKIMKEVTK